ncbi:MAG: site-specific DNA-methyltransferase [Hyphomicrobiaceae bacterium]|nr:MAG: site-specific DNA-methyltransferase [Hyphomicrobiaceae bacterium]
MEGVVKVCDCLDELRKLPDKCVDLVFCSPPYEAARTYGIGFKLRGQGWVDWAVERFVECQRVSRGLVAWVVEGQTRKFQWSATPALLMADLHRAGVKLRKPPVFHRVGIPGSGGPDWWRNNYEFCVCSSHGKLPWSDNTATGHAPKWGPGGEMSHRLPDGARVNQWGRVGGKRGAGNVSPDGEQMRVQCYTPPVKANPGNVIKCNVGGGRMGSKLAEENEAPFPEKLAEAFIKCFCPPGGVVLDPFCGSGTTLAVADRLGREWIGYDVRQSQVDLSLRRIAESREKHKEAV